MFGYPHVDQRYPGRDPSCQVALKNVRFQDASCCPSAFPSSLIPLSMTFLPNSQFSNLIRTDFWFNDGNIILIAQNAAFKVHKGQLARHSEVFNDLFSLPQPSNPPPSPSLQTSSGTADDLIDGCPFVILQDSPSDVFYFLSALYDGLYVRLFAFFDIPTSPLY